MFTALILGGGVWGGLPGVDPYPRPIMQYTEHLYRPVFDPHGPFRLRENGERLLWTGWESDGFDCSVAQYSAPSPHSARPPSLGHLLPARLLL